MSHVAEASHVPALAIRWQYRWQFRWQSTPSSDFEKYK